MSSYLLQEDGVSKILLEDGSGAILLEAPPVSLAVTGTIVTNTTEAEIVMGGRTIVLTITNDTWVAAGVAFDAQRQNIINGLTSSQGEPFGWNALVKGAEVVTAVARTSNTVVTITLSPVPLYNIAFDETITVTVPATALTGGVALVGSPAFGISYIPMRWGGDDAPPPRRARRKRSVREETEALLTEMEATLRGTFAGESDAAETEMPPVLARAERIEAAVATLASPERQFPDLQQRVAQLKQDLQAYYAALLAEDDADWEWFLS